MDFGKIVNLVYKTKDTETKWRDEYAKGVEARFQAFQQKYREQVLQGILATAYISGKQDNMINKAYTEFIDIYSDADQRRSLPRNFPINLLVDPFRTQLYYLINSDPPMEVVSALNQDNKKQNTAEVYTNTFKYLENNIWNWGRYRGVACNDALQAGTVVGELYPQLVNGRIELGLKHRMVCEIATSEDADGCLIDEDTVHIIKDVKSLGWLKKNYADATEAIAKISRELSKEMEPPANQFQLDIQKAFGYDKVQSVYKLSGDDRQVVVYAVYHKPTNEFENGWYQVSSRGIEIAYLDKLPISKDKKSVMPLTQLDSNGIITARKIKDTPFSDVISSQSLYNILINNMAASGVIGSKPPIDLYTGVIILDKDNKPVSNQYPRFGDFFRWNLSPELEMKLQQNPQLWSVVKPGFMQTPQMSGVAVELINEIKTGITNSTSQAFSNIGNLPRDTSGKSLNIQGQIDQMGNRPVIELWFDYKKRLYKKVMTAINCLYPAETLKLILGDKLGFEVGDFEAENIDDSYDVQFTISSETPATIGGKINRLAGLKGVLGPEWFPAIDEQALRILNKGGVLDKDPDSDSELALAENDKITHDPKLIDALKQQVPQGTVDPISGVPYEEPTSVAEHVMRSWVNMFQRHEPHIIQHRPLAAGPDTLTNGPEITTLAGYHSKAHMDMSSMQAPPPMPVEAGKAQLGVPSPPKPQPQPTIDSQI